MRGHGISLFCLFLSHTIFLGETETDDDTKLDINTLAEDSVALSLIESFFLLNSFVLVNTILPAHNDDGIILMGHSLGGAVAVNAAVTNRIVCYTHF